MKHEKINATILKIKKLEGKAISLQLKLDNIREKWEREYEKIKDTEEWKNSCHESDIATNYNFGDVLA